MTSKSVELTVPYHSLYTIPCGIHGIHGVHGSHGIDYGIHGIGYGIHMEHSMWIPCSFHTIPCVFHSQSLYFIIFYTPFHMESMEWWWNPPIPYGIYWGVLSTGESLDWTGSDSLNHLILQIEPMLFC